MNSKQNPLYKRTGLPMFDQIEPEHFVPAVQDVFKKTEQILKSVEENPKPTWEALQEPFQETNFDFEYTWAVLNHLKSVKNCHGLREAYDELMPDCINLMLKMSQSKSIYDATLELRKSKEFEKLSNARKRIIRTQLISAKHSGIALDGEEKERFNWITKRLSELSNKFSNNVLDATKAFALEITDKKDTETWPETLKKIAAKNYAKRYPEQEPDSENGPWAITLDIPTYMPFMKNSTNREQKRQVYHAYTTRASEGEFDNTEVIKEILRLRKEKAQLLGYRNHDELTLRTKMAGKLDNVLRMIQELEEAARPIAEKEHQELVEFAKKHGFTEELMPWDMQYWSERLRESLYSYKQEEMRQYFPMPQVLDALFALTNRLFGVTIKESEYENIPKWHEDVKFFNVYDEDMSLIAHFYLDPYSRPSEKRGGAWMNTCRNRRVINGELTRPVIYVICNGTVPIGDQPSLMTFDEVNTLYHEFGHALQGMLTTIDDYDAAGVHGVEWDAVELASQFMENWCLQEETFMQMAKHYKTGETISKELYEKVKASNYFRNAYAMQRQLIFVKIDLYLHGDYDPDDDEESVFDAFVRISKETCSSAPVYENDKFLCAFSHIFAGGYSAGYYSYKWAEVLSADAFAAFEEAGLDNEEAVRRIGRRFRDTVLALGGSMHPSEVYRMFRGRDATTEALLRHHFGNTMQKK